LNFKSLAAFLIAVIVLAVTVLGSGDAEKFLDGRAILIVVGGTVAAGAISFQVDRILVMLRIFGRSLLARDQSTNVELIDKIVKISEAKRLGAADLRALVESCNDHFLKEAMELVLEGVLEHERIIKVLHERINTMYERECEEVIQFRTIGRYPPAFGLIGTTLSMITLLAKLGGSEGQKVIGPAMAIGLVATFYGLVLSNMVFNPISERLAQATRRKKNKNLMVVEGIDLILQKTNPVILVEELNSFLPPHERTAWKPASADPDARAA